MISVYQACEIAKEYLESLSSGGNSLVINTMFNFDSGVFFSYQSKEFLDSNDFDHFLVGVQPFIVNKGDCSIFHKPDLILNRDELISLFKKEIN